VTTIPVPTRKAQHVENPNQVSPLVNYNVFTADAALVAAVERGDAAWAKEKITELGSLLGTEEAQRWGVEANENPPTLHTHDRNGNRRDEVLFHPAWHQLMQTSIAHKLHSLPWTDMRHGAHVARAAMMMITVQNEAGHTCPVSMTYSGMAALRVEPEVAKLWESKILSSDYDAAFAPVDQKKGALLGMGMTEKQGGSDVRANTTRAERIGNSREFLITGHKWFCSAPMCDAFLILAQTANGLSCFLLPRWTATGEKNNFFIQRLKDKLGNRSNASSEVEFSNAWAQLVGEEGRGINTIIEMVNHTRLDCAIAGAGLMRQALVQALHHCCHRAAFGKLLIEQPLMQNVLADLVLESEAATLMAVRLAESFDLRAGDEAQRVFARIATAISKYWLCKRVSPFVGEALECFGGNGYVEESPMPRLYREAPLYGIWEGSGNVICLDILRALKKEPATAEALLHEFQTAKGMDQRFDLFTNAIENDLAHMKKNFAASGQEGQSRRLADRLALALQTSLMIRHASAANAQAFIASRIGYDHGANFGTLSSAHDLGAILEPVAKDFS
jgi:putative acyl-CoA dehydrogenase